MRRRLVATMVAVFCIVGMPLAVAGDQGVSLTEGEKVFAAQKCSLCHQVAGKGNKAGALDRVGSKYTAAELREWIVNPAETAKKHNATRKPPMKSYAALPQADVDALVAYLQTLKK